MRKQTAEAGAAVGDVRGGHSLPTVDPAEDKRRPASHGNPIENLPGRAVVGGVEDHVAVAKQGLGVFICDRRMDGLNPAVRIEAAQFFGRRRLPGTTEISVGV